MSTAQTFPDTLTPIQHQVIALLAQGQSTTVAAEACSLHRTTIHHWKRTNPDFANALADAREDAADHRRAQAHVHGDVALQAVRDLLDNPSTPPSVRLKAALYILNLAAPSTNNGAVQSKRTQPVPPPARPATPDSSQFNTSPASSPKIGRNAPCPCQSGRKYKHCCWLLPNAA